MKTSSLKSTTSLVVSFALAASPLAAQQAAVDLSELPICAGLDDTQAIEDVLFPCVDLDGNLVADQDMLDAVVAGGMTDGPPPEATVEEAPTEVAPSAEVAEPVAEPQEPPVAAVEAPEPVVEEAPVEETAPEEAVAEPEVPTEDAVEAPEPVVEEVPVEEAAPEEAMAEPVEEPAVTAEPAPQEEAVVEPEQQPAEVEPVTPPAEQPVAPEVETVEQDEPPAAAAAEAADQDVTDETEIAVEELTAEDVRSSDQDFETRATGDAAAVTPQSRDRGLSNFEKALLLGLGAAVVGSVLKNGDEVKSNSGDRVVVERDGDLVVLKDDDVLLRQPGTRVQTQTFDDGSTRTVVLRDDGTQIVTIRASDGRVLRRARVLEDGTQVLLFDDTVTSQAVTVKELPSQTTAPTQVSQANMAALRQALMADRDADFGRSFSLRQIRSINAVRILAPEVELDTVTFASGSAAIDPSQAEELTNLGLAISSIVVEDPSQVFLIEGHTDAVGDAAYNLALSDRRAETVALAMTEYFGVPPENLITQGYGESFLKVQTQTDERANRRASVRNITPLLR